MDNDPDLVLFPLPSQESIFDLIVTQCSKSQDNFQCEAENNVTKSITSRDPHIIEKHWSHQIHLLQQLQFLSLRMIAMTVMMIGESLYVTGVFNP